jgi:hypothetical protein
LPFDTLAELDGSEMTFRIYQATSGLVGLTIELCKQAAGVAVAENATQLTLKHFRKAYLDGLATIRGKHRDPFGSLADDWEPVSAGFWMRDRQFGK